MSIRVYFLVIGIAFFIGIEGKSLSTGKLDERINYLLNITQVEKKFNTVINASVGSDPALAPYKSEMISFINKFLSFPSLRPHIVEIYRDTYTLSDINGMIKFYSSALGKKLIEKETKVEVRLTQLIQNQLQKQMPQIMVWFQQAFNKNYSKAQLN